MDKAEDFIEVGVVTSDNAGSQTPDFSAEEQELRSLVNAGDIESMLDHPAFLRKTEEVQVRLAEEAIKVTEGSVTDHMYELYREGGIYTQAAIDANLYANDLRRARLEALRIHYQNKRRRLKD